jgi:hypothetical protein
MTSEIKAVLTTAPRLAIFDRRLTVVSTYFRIVGQTTGIEKSRSGASAALSPSSDQRGAARIERRRASAAASTSRMDSFTRREMRIAGLSISATIVALGVAETGGYGAFSAIRIALAVLGLGLVLFAGRLSLQSEARS